MSDESTRFDSLPQTSENDDLPTRESVLDYWAGRFGIGTDTFEGYTFWERGSGKIWAFSDAFDLSTPVDIEGLGMSFLRTRREHWKPTTEAVQRFGREADRNVIHLSESQATAFIAGRDQEVPWDGDWGYLIATHDLAGRREPIGVGLYLNDELRSQIPKGRRREFE